MKKRQNGRWTILLMINCLTKTFCHLTHLINPMSELFEKHFWQDEKWRDVVDYEGYYQISSLGRLRSVDRAVVFQKVKFGVRRVFKGRIIKLSKSKTGYLRILLYRHGKKKNFLVHRLVLEAFHGPCPSGKECGHLDGTRNNNAASNLKWVTKKENVVHSVIHGTRRSQKGEWNTQSKLMEKDIIEIRRRRRGGEKLSDIAEDFPVTKAHIGDIARGVLWGSVR